MVESMLGESLCMYIYIYYINVVATSVLNTVFMLYGTRVYT